jgi:NAD(P)-dependent dehydrogenase (short-subunit alcohol dehydrogenase family)
MRPGDRGGRAFALLVDVSDGSAVDRMMRAVVERAGRLDIRVNNAGIVGRIGALETGEEDWDAMMPVNAKGVFLCARRAAAEVCPRGGSDRQTWRPRRAPAPRG